jgi:site-specific DNA-methyltransferase (adenine-specific)
MKYQILHGDNRETLKTLPDNSVDAIVTDPPYGIDFLGKAWDANTGALETYQECLRVLKPGGHILAFSAARTYHHLAVTLEQAGFEIRDQIMWIYSSGFPKSQDVGRSIQRSLGVKELDRVVDTTKNAGFGQTDHARVRAGEEWSTTAKQVGVVKCTDPEAQAWEGWGTALKPAHEPICMARKPLKLSIAKNCQTHGVGALNIDACRVPYEDDKDIETYLNNKRGPMERSTATDGEGIGMFGGEVGYRAIKREVNAEQDLPQGRFPSNVLGEIPDYQKYFYCPKVSRAERHIGFDELPAPYDRRTERGESGSAGLQGLQKLNGEKRTDGGNNHPTVKPIELMKYLIRLITPPGGTVLDPFSGSGSTGCAVVELGYEYIGCELDEKYVAIARRRIEAWYAETNPTTFNQLFEQE